MLAIAIDRPMPTDEVIRTSALRKVYDGADFAAVDGLELSVRAGEIFGLLGPNGAGKTTTAGMLTTRVIPTSGNAYVGAIDVVAQPALAKQLIGIVSQTNTLDRQLNVWENLYFHGRLFGIGAADSRRLADELLAKMHLSKWAKASVYALSGGMAQRLMMARAILHRPAVLFLDEPTAGLDPQSRLALWEILGELNREGQTILLTTHYMEEADELCNRLAIMDHGKILALGTPAELKRSVGAEHDRHDQGRRRARRARRATLAGDRRGHADAPDRRRHRAARKRSAAARTARRRGRRRRRLRARRPVGRRAEPRGRLHQPHRQGAARLMAGTVTQPTAPPPAPSSAISLTPTRSTFAASRTALRALVLRDLVVLKKNFGEFVVRTLVQPFLLVFVFLYVFPTIGQGVGGGGGKAAESEFATVLVAGVVGISIMFQGIQAVAMVMAQEFGFTREIEDRVQAPCPIWLVAVAKVLSGATQGLIAALIVFPIAAVDPRQRRRSASARALGRRADADPARLRDDDLARAAARHAVRSAQPRPDVRLRRAAADVPRRHLLPVDEARAGQGRRRATGCRSSC